MEAMREAWTDDRLDYLNRRVDDGFTEVNRRFEEVDRRFEEVDRRFDRFEAQVDQRFNSLEAQVDQRLGKVETELHRVHDRMDSAVRAAWYIGSAIFVALLGIVVQL
ncbi:MAG TPA: hypothetical protein VFY48_09370 [Solirubrobacterales bacterium]|nr:hypothetical protein [Solirubrobacterales bacterium]